MLKSLLIWYEEKFKKEPVVVLGVTIVLIISGIGSFSIGINACQGFVRYVKMEFFEDKHSNDYAKIDDLDVGLHLGFVDEVFGAPKVRRKSGGFEGYSESLYVKEHYLLHIVSNDNDEVRMYSITAINKDFHPTFPIDEYGRLGEIKIDDFRSWGVGNISMIISSKYFAYSEIHYFGNPGYYKYYGIGYSQLGVELNEESTISEMITNGYTKIDELEKNKEFLEVSKMLVPNSYCVIGEEFQIDNMKPFQIGFSYLDGRTLID